MSWAYFNILNWIFRLKSLTINRCLRASLWDQGPCILPLHSFRLCFCLVNTSGFCLRFYGGNRAPLSRCCAKDSKINQNSRKTVVNKQEEYSVRKTHKLWRKLRESPMNPERGRDQGVGNRKGEVGKLGGQCRSTKQVRGTQRLCNSLQGGRALSPGRT